MSCMWPQRTHSMLVGASTLCDIEVHSSKYIVLHFAFSSTLIICIEQFMSRPKASGKRDMRYCRGRQVSSRCLFYFALMTRSLSLWRTKWCQSGTRVAINRIEVSEFHSKKWTPLSKSELLLVDTTCQSGQSASMWGDSNLESHFRQTDTVQYA